MQADAQEAAQEAASSLQAMGLELGNAGELCITPLCTDVLKYGLEPAMLHGLLSCWCMAVVSLLLALLAEIEAVGVT